MMHEHMTEKHLQTMEDIIKLALERVEGKHPMAGIPSGAYSDADIAVWEMVVRALRRYKGE